MVFGIAAAATAQGRYVGSGKCAGCHEEEFRRQSESAHARALFPAARHPLAAKFAGGSELKRAGRYEFGFSVGDGGLTVRVMDAANFMDIPVQWAFGAGEQAVTFVSRVDQNWYLEHSFTYYRATGGMGATPGQRDRIPATLADAAGLVYKSRDRNTGIVKCFECHSTGPVEASGAEIRTFETGVRCEVCHGPGSAHVESAGRGSIANPGRMKPAEMNVFCGRCHRPPEETAGQIDWKFAWNVRHQPSYFSQSACFRKSKGTMSCLTCHGPHESMVRGTAYYNGVCGSCHEAAHAKEQRTNCVDCHMPLVSPQPPLRFTNHWIGVYAAGSRLKPIERRR